MKLVVSDLDGTLLNNESVVSEETKEIIKKLRAKGIEFAIATGRSFNSANKIRESMGIDIFLICNNGANIYGRNGELIKRNFMPKELSERIVKMLLNNNIEFFAFDGLDCYVPYGMEIEEYLKKEHTIYYIEKDKIEFIPGFEKILIIEQNPERLIEIKNLAHKNFDTEVEIVVSAVDCIDFNVKNCSKMAGVEFISKELGIDKKDIMAFGDSGNDYKMLKYVAYPVAMKDSYMSEMGIENVTEYSNDESGVARYLKKFFEL